MECPKSALPPGLKTGLPQFRLAFLCQRSGNFLILILLMLSACVTPGGKSADETQPTQTSIATINPPSPTQTSITTITPPSPIQSTSTPDKSYEIPGSAFCQLAPTTAYPGLTVNITAYKFPANHPVSVLVDFQEVATTTTDSNGYVNIDIVIPPIEWAGWVSVYVIASGTGFAPACPIWLETELNPDPTPTRTPTPTLSPDEIAVTATQQALHDQLDKHCGTGRPALRIGLSPDGQWAVLACESEAIALVRMDESKVWRLSSESLIGPYSEFFINFARWSKDGTYAYVVADPHTDGFWEPFHQGAVLFRIHLETGQISEVLPKGTDGYIFYAYTFSPDDKTLAYIVTDESPVVLTLRDLQTGDEQKIAFDPKYNTGGGYIWSPDGRKFVFSVAQYDTTVPNHDYVAVSIYLWDQENKEMLLLIEDYPEFLEPHQWVEESKIILHAEIAEQGKLERITLELDLESRELKQIEP